MAFSAECFEGMCSQCDCENSCMCPCHLPEDDGPDDEGRCPDCGASRCDECEDDCPSWYEDGCEEDDDD